MRDQPGALLHVARSLQQAFVVLVVQPLRNGAVAQIAHGPVKRRFLL